MRVIKDIKLFLKQAFCRHEWESIGDVEYLKSEERITHFILSMMCPKCKLRKDIIARVREE